MGPNVHPLVTIPADGAHDVALGQSIRVQFDRFLAPLAAIRQSVCVHDVGPATIDAGVKCVTFTEPEYDPVDRVAVWKPSAPLAPGVRYTVDVLAPTSESDPFGIRAFDGAPLERTFSFSFTTGDASVPSAEPNRSVPFCYVSPKLCGAPADACSPPRRTSATTAGAGAVLGGCGEGSNHCHSRSDVTFKNVDRPPYGSALVLDDGGIGEFIGKVAIETATGPNPFAPNRSGAPFGVNMPYVDPANPANSYLVYKLILGLYDPETTTTITVPSPFAFDTYSCDAFPDAAAALDDAGACPVDAGVTPVDPDSGLPAGKLASKGDHVRPAVDPWIPVEQWQPPAPGEMDRLKLRIRGKGMPLHDNVLVESVHAVSAWIAAGAKYESCAF